MLMSSEEAGSLLNSSFRKTHPMNKFFKSRNSEDFPSPGWRHHAAFKNVFLDLQKIRFVKEYSVEKQNEF